MLYAWLLRWGISETMVPAQRFTDEHPGSQVMLYIEKVDDLTFAGGL